MTRLPDPDASHRTRTNRRAWDITDPTPAEDTVPQFVTDTVRAWTNDFNALITRTPTLETDANPEDTP